MKLSAISSAGGGDLMLGAEAYFQPIAGIITIGEAEYLQAGLSLVNERANYPELYEIFAVGETVTAPEPRPLADGEILNYMRIK